MLQTRAEKDHYITMSNVSFKPEGLKSSGTLRPDAGNVVPDVRKKGAAIV